MTIGKIKLCSPDICQKSTNISDFQKKLQLTVRATEPSHTAGHAKERFKFKTFGEGKQ
jgi:hypothetical protein